MRSRIRAAKAGGSDRHPQWQLAYLEAAEKDARKFLTEEQYAHVVQLFDELACESDPTKSQTQNVEKIDEFYELKDKGGILGRINVRVYFTVIGDRKLILALHAYKKEDEGKAPPHVVTCVRNRLRVATKELGQKGRSGDHANT